MYSNLNQFDAVFGAALFIIVLFILAISITIAVFYLLNLQNLLKEIDQKNRLVEPGNVWLMFIPLFNLIYPFILYPKICDSVKAEYEHRGISIQGDYSRSISIAMPILGLCGLIPFIGGLAGLANLVLFIIFWVRTAEYKSKLRTTPKGGSNLSSKTDILD